MDITRRKCPWCGGLFYLDEGVALCPHCRKPVKAPGHKARETLGAAYAQALAERLAYWQAEMAELAASFPEAAARLRKELLG